MSSYLNNACFMQLGPADLLASLFHYSFKSDEMLSKWKVLNYNLYIIWYIQYIHHMD